jgi:hypothetical protein
MASVIAAASIKISIELFSWGLQRTRADLVSLFEARPRSRPLYALASEQLQTGSFSQFSARSSVGDRLPRAAAVA